MLKISYDKSGNITALKTYFSTPSGVLMDDFTYNYTANTNKLSSVTDAASSSVSTTDIDNQSVNNYLYDNNGNLEQDLQNSVGFVINDIFNKPIQIYKTDGTIINYVYDSNGNRVLNATANKYYVNNELGMNEAIVDKSNNNIITHNIFGTDMIGQIDRVNTTLTRYYYLKDHLGSIKMRVTNNGTVDGWDDYYPFGSIMNGRSYTSGLNVKYKFTGKERDEETKCDYFGARFYESRLGRWLSIDPLADKYPGWNPYNYCVNNPILNIDPNGMDWYVNNSGALLWYNGQYGNDEIPQGYFYLGNDSYFKDAFLYKQLKELGISTINLNNEQSTKFAQSFGFVLAPYNSVGDYIIDRSYNGTYYSMEITQGTEVWNQLTYIPNNYNFTTSDIYITEKYRPGGSGSQVNAVIFKTYKYEAPTVWSELLKYSNPFTSARAGQTGFDNTTTYTSWSEYPTPGTLWKFYNSLKNVR